MLADRIKKYMNDIIDIAFKDVCVSERNNYKNYNLNILTKEVKSTSGMYKPKCHIIQIYNASLGAKHLAKCCLHELSHHIDYVKHGKSGHQKPFYNIYKKLIYASLDMGVLSKEDFYDEWSSDGNKVKSIVDRYIPHPVEYTIDIKPIIRVYNCFNIKEQLKQNGYRWNKLEQVWEREQEDEDISILEKIGVVKSLYTLPQCTQPYYIIEKPSIYVDAVVYIIATGNTYEARDTLKQYHFYFDNNKKSWICKEKSSMIDCLMQSLEMDERLKECQFSIMKRK